MKIAGCCRNIGGNSRYYIAVDTWKGTPPVTTQLHTHTYTLIHTPFLTVCRISVIIRCFKAKFLRMKESEVHRRMAAMVGVCATYLIVWTLVEPDTPQPGAQPNLAQCQLTWWAVIPVFGKDLHRDHHNISSWFMLLCANLAKCQNMLHYKYPTMLS